MAVTGTPTRRYATSQDSLKTIRFYDLLTGSLNQDKETLNLREQDRKLEVRIVDSRKRVDKSSHTIVESEKRIVQARDSIVEFQKTVSQRQEKQSLHQI